MAKAMFSTMESILNAFRTFKTAPYWSLWSGTTLITSYSGDSDDESESKLSSILEALMESGNTELFTLRFHATPGQDGHVDNKTKYYASIYIRVLDNMSYIPKENSGGMAPGYYPRLAIGGGGNNQMLEQIKLLIETQNKEINERLARLEAEEVEQEDDGDPEEMLTGTIGAIQNILSHPFVAKILSHPAIIGWVSNLLSNVKLPGMSNTPQPQVSGIGDQPETTTAPELTPEQQQAKFQDALNRLANHCDVLDVVCKVADMADNKPAFFKTLLAMLDNQ